MRDQKFKESNQLALVINGTGMIVKGAGQHLDKVKATSSTEKMLFEVTVSGTTVRAEFAIGYVRFTLAWVDCDTGCEATASVYCGNGNISITGENLAVDLIHEDNKLRIQSTNNLEHGFADEIIWDCNRLVTVETVRI